MLIENVRENVKKRLDPRTLKILETTKEPNWAYVVAEKWKLTNGPGGKVAKPSIAWLRVEQQPNQNTQVQHWVNKLGLKLITYGNFPSRNTENQAKATLYNLHNEANSINPFDDLRNLCENLLNDSAADKLAEENRGLAAELEALKRKLKEQEDGRKESQGASKEDRSAAAKHRRASAGNDHAQESGDGPKL